MGASKYIRRIRDRFGHGLLLLPAVAVIIRDARGRVLHVQERDVRAWGLPAGGIEPGETPLDAARRELWEETGLRDMDLELIGCCGGEEFRHEYPNGDKVEYSIFVFGGWATEAARLGPTDHKEVRQATFFSRTEAPALSLPYPPQLVWNGGM